MNVYERLKKLCEANNTSITALCLKVTGNKGNLTTWKNNNGQMRSDYLAKCADELGCSTDYLLGRSETPEINHPTRQMQKITITYAAEGEGSQTVQKEITPEVMEKINRLLEQD